MGIKIDKKIENGSVIVSFQIDGADFTPFVDKAKNKEIANVEMKGFRKGNVPKELAEKHISKSAYLQNAMHQAIDGNWPAIVEQIKDEKIATRPDVKVLAIDDEKMSVEIFSKLIPEIKLGDLSKIDLKLETSKLTDAEIKQQKEGLQSLLRKHEEIKEGTIKKDDVANIDFLGKVDGVAFEGGEAKGFDLKIGSKQFIDTFEDQLIGKNVGDDTSVEVTFPEQYPQKELAGKKATFDVKINSIKVEKDLEGDELKAKLKQFNFESKEEFEKEVLRMAQQQKDHRAHDEFFAKYVEEVKKLEGTEINVLDEMLEPEIEAEFKKFSQKLQQQGMSMKEYLKMLEITEKEFKEKNLRTGAERRVAEGLVYEALIDHFKIDVTNEEIEAEIKKIADTQKIKVEQVKQQVPADRFASSLKYEKLIERISK